MSNGERNIIRMVRLWELRWVLAVLFTMFLVFQGMLLVMVRRNTEMIGGLLDLYDLYEYVETNQESIIQLQEVVLDDLQE